MCCDNASSAMSSLVFQMQSSFHNNFDCGLSEEYLLDKFNNDRVMYDRNGLEIGMHQYIFQFYMYSTVLLRTSTLLRVGSTSSIPTVQFARKGKGLFAQFSNQVKSITYHHFFLLTRRLRETCCLAHSQHRRSSDVTIKKF